MANFRGRLEQGGSPVLDQVTVQLEMHTKGFMRSWDGHFGVPAGKRISPGMYRLILADGRSGDVLVKSVSMGSHQATVASFKGSGPLQ